MSLLEKKIYLASRSPRRRELLKQIGVNFELLLMRSYPAGRADIDETPGADESAGEYVLRIARAKAEAGWMRLLERGLPKFPVLGADTAVALDDEILGKPDGQQQAEDMLRKLSGQQHQVFSAVAIAYEGAIDVLLSRTMVAFGELSDAVIRAYVLSGEPFDKAGGYGIQGRAASFIEQIQGSYTGVVGLPLYETTQLLRKFGMPAS
jgi:septum formation protein